MTLRPLSTVEPPPLLSFHLHVLFVHRVLHHDEATTDNTSNEELQPTPIGIRHFAASQKDINEAQSRMVYVNDPDRSNIDGHPNNSISTAKYSLLTFLPKNLFEQFHRIAYIYFLVLVCINQIPSLAVTAVKDAYEDYRRHLSDRLRIPAPPPFSPLQLLPLSQSHGKPFASVTDPTGVAYLQTINLDGESNLKTRDPLCPPENLNSTIVIRCENPNRNIYSFHANLTGDDRHRGVSLGPSNVVLRGCELKNTTWVVGVAVYTGRETKVMLNSSVVPSKRSRLETQMNRETLILAVALLAICSTEEDFRRKNRKYDYYGIVWEIVFTFFMAVILFQVLIPIALYISMELVRLGQAFFMIQDKNMFDKETGKRFQCRALNINEDLGQIKYVFSDKTGTLTENKMEFHSVSIAGEDYSATATIDDSISVMGRQVEAKVKGEDGYQTCWIVKESKRSEKREFAREFFLALATCNTIVPIVTESKEAAGVKFIDYQGESPDEQALVYAAAAYGFVLVERTSGHIVVDVFGEKQRFDILGLHEFDSDRKRMSVIVRLPDKTLKLFVKGADSSMLSILKKTANADVIRATEMHLQSYSSTGLRTLVIGARELNRKQLEEWHSSYEKASTALLGRGSLLKAVANHIENDVRILGASGVEDKLQQGVPEAIESLRQAGIKVWILTGDKQETAVSIGYSSRLLTPEMTRITINGSSKESCKKTLEESALALASKARSTRHALVIDGKSLLYILETELEEELFQVATTCHVVLCCRVAPLQKAGIVALIKKRTDDMTLAIGDGANDVSMIQMADVGIGISGKEGRQAVMASDFAMGQFRFLVTLLLVHGHWNYQRMAYMILYNFYRNSVFVFVLLWYVLYTAFSLTSAVTEWSSALYSVIYTALPTIVVGILDKDLSRRTLIKYPQLYGAGQREEGYNLKLFILTMLDSVWQSLVIFFVPCLAYRHSTVDGSSIGDLLDSCGSRHGKCSLGNGCLQMELDYTQAYMGLHCCNIRFASSSSMLCPSCLDFGKFCRAIFHVMGTWVFWFCLAAILVVGMVPRFTVKALAEFFRPNDIQIARGSRSFLIILLFVYNNNTCVFLNSW
ncbi:hypothetical protein HPP92_028208 [Vanilla planifolia]|uniref:Phospholipid-transporting ATPase n=1 Tax=Vanilla planifolia TaxID=51239 RepID=A0A835P6E8_VANPL|nr:hypothetical protein HPP92_028208 [Vanilla planifolia]